MCRGDLAECHFDGSFCSLSVRMGESLARRTRGERVQREEEARRRSRSRLDVVCGVHDDDINATLPGSKFAYLRRVRLIREERAVLRPERMSLQAAEKVGSPASEGDLLYSPMVGSDPGGASRSCRIDEALPSFLQHDAPLIIATMVTHSKAILILALRGTVARGRRVPRKNLTKDRPDDFTSAEATTTGTQLAHVESSRACPRERGSSLGAT